MTSRAYKNFLSQELMHEGHTFARTGDAEFSKGYLGNSRADLVLFDEPESGVDLGNIVLVPKTIDTLLEKDGIPTKKKSKMKMKLEGTKMGLIIDYIRIHSGPCVRRQGTSALPSEAKLCQQSSGNLRCVGESGHEE